MLPVVLEDGDDAASARVAAQGPVAADGPSQRRQLRWWPVAAVAAVALVGGQAALDQRERAALGRLRDLPGVLLPLDESVRELWRTDDLSGMPGAGVGSDLALGVMRPDGSQAVRLVDGATGDVRWEVPVTGAETTPPAEQERAWSGPSCAQATDGLLACQVADQYEAVNDPATLLRSPEPGMPAPTRTRWVVIDVDAERVVAEHPGPLHSPAAVTGDLFVVSTTTADQAVVVEARDLRTGDVRWRQPLAEAPAEDEAVTGSPHARDASAASTRLSALPDGRLLVHHQQTDWVLSASGDVLHTIAQPQQESMLQHVRESTFVISPLDAVGTSSLIHPDGSRTRARGWPLTLSVDDGSAPGQCFLNNGGLLVVDCATGAPLWDAGSIQPGAGILLDGILYLTSGAWIVAVDTAQGRTLWTWERGDRGVYWESIFTDGRDLYVVDWQADAGAPTGDRDATGSFHVVALSTEDGSELWAAPLDVHARPSDVWATVLAGRLLVREMSADGDSPIRLFGNR
ncbi:PQQ-binding-like beta-propeller repeat protein [Cellulomonas timonensis]|uniref:hypothetical protein n=1 Tax=Cellulomonas timonensis TaxID=1689271 RepID=UPI00082B8D53|nr:hypothetical protein [Cellulomonas timonensis]